MSDTSIRTPAWGVTSFWHNTRMDIDISIRTPAWVVTILPKASTAPDSFQFAPPRGG